MKRRGLVKRRGGEGDCIRIGARERVTVSERGRISGRNRKGGSISRG